MPQIGWFEILLIVVVSILVIGPKDIPIMLKKIGNWIGNIKRYFNDIQKDFTDIENVVEDELSVDNNHYDKNKDNKKNE